MGGRPLCSRAAVEVPCQPRSAGPLLMDTLCSIDFSKYKLWQLYLLHVLFSALGTSWRRSYQPHSKCMTDWAMGTSVPGVGLSARG